MQLVRMIEDLQEGTLVQYLGVHVTRWQPEWSDLPDGYGGKVRVIGFIEDEDAARLIDACRLLITQYEVDGNLTNLPYLRIKAALAALEAK